MNKGLTFGAGLGIGTIVMYVLDPDRGKRRRALLRDKYLSTTRKTGEAIELTARDFTNRAQGIAASIPRQAGAKVPPKKSSSKKK